MGVDYQEFKQHVKNREFQYFKSYATIIKTIDEFYDENDMKFFYPKNLFNDKQTEFIIFLENGLLIIKHEPEEEQQFRYEHYYCKVTSKTLLNTRNDYGNQQLLISFDNGKEIKLHNLEDSNDNWEHDYKTFIRELYKLI